MIKNQIPKVYVTATAHLDTVWNWSLNQTVKEFLINTLEDNFKLFKKYPDYRFNFEGAYRYQLIKEFYPELYQELKRYIQEGKWYLAGSAWENGDVIIPSVEALIRNYLYGNRFFKQEFGEVTNDIFLPDCFGFPHSLPSIAGHMGLKAFSTAKLVWNSGNYIPFKVGVWYGPDGSSVIATLDPGQYISKVDGVLSQDENLKKAVRRLNVPKIMRYYGVGDMGGAPDEGSVQNVTASVRDENPKVAVVSRYAGQIADEMSEEERGLLPTYNGGLLMTTHGVGTYTSFGILKRLNRKNEELADLCERLNGIADWLGYKQYPKNGLEAAWKRVIRHQFHDDITGTSSQKVYVESINDLVVSINQFEHELVTAAESITDHIVTDRITDSIPIVVFNTASFERTDVAEACLKVKSPSLDIQVFDACGKPVLTQVVARSANSIKIIFHAQVPSCGYATYYAAFCNMAENGGEVYACPNELANEKYTVKIDENGDISSIFDKQNQKELLKQPIHLQVLENTKTDFGSWEILYKDIAKEPKSIVGGNAVVSVAESGPVRASVKIERECGNSRYTQIVSLSHLSDRIDIDNVVFWHESASLLKAAFTYTCANEAAIYDGGIGTALAHNSNERQYEFPVNRWINLSDTEDDYSVTMMSDCKYGWDKPDDHTLRLSLIHTPFSKWSDDARQDLQDFGENRFSYSIIGRKGDWQKQNPYIGVAYYNEPLVAIQTTVHPGTLLSVNSFISINTDQIQLRTFKMAEDSHGMIVRVYEAMGREANQVLLNAGEGICWAEEVNGYENTIAPAEIKDAALSFHMGPYQTKAFRLILKEKKMIPDHQYIPLLIKNDLCISSRNDHRGEYGIGDEKTTIPAELLPDSLVCGGVPFLISKNADETHSALVANRQKIRLSAGTTEVFLLACSTQGDIDTELFLDDRKAVLHVQDMTERVGGWDQYAIQHTGHIKRDVIAYCSSHTHNITGDCVCGRAYLFCYKIPVESGESVLTLPDDNRILVTAITAYIGNHYRTCSASVLYDIK